MAKVNGGNTRSKNLKPVTKSLISDFLGNIPYPVIVYGPDRGIRFVNPAFLKLSGFKQSELIGKTPPFPFWISDKPKYYKSSYFKTDSAVRQWLIQKKDGEEVWIETINQSFQSGEANPGVVSYIQDITEKKKASEDAQQSDNKFLKVFNAIPLPLAITSLPDRKFVDVNKAFLKTGGYRREDFIGKPAPDLNWQDPSARDQVDQNVQKKRDISDFEMRLVSKDGKSHTALMSAKVVKLKDREFTISVSTDITEMKQAEEALRESEAFNASLLRDAPNPILVLNPDSSIRFVNPVFSKLTGYSKKELLGKIPPFPWWPKDKKDEYWKENNFSTTQEIDSIERLILKKNRDQAWISISIRHVKEDAQVKYYIAIWTDVTERKKAEQALQESEIFNARLLNDAPNPILVTNPDSSFKYANPALEKLTGYNSHEFIGKKAPPPWWPPEKIELYTSEDQEDTQKELAFYERLFRNQNGQTFWVTMSIRRIEDKGKVKYFLANWVDVTERKQMEENLNASYQKEKLQREELEEEARLRGHFINVLAHELRTPITPILSSTDMLKNMYASKKESIQKKLVENIYTSSNTLAQRLEELLDMARHARGAFKLNIQPVGLEPFLDGVITRFKPTLIRLKQKMVVDLDNNLPEAELDASRLEQVFINLLSNASKFSGVKSSIYLSVKVTDSELLVDVKDNGIGISPEAQARLFQPYYRVEQDRHPVPGLGLGLAVSKQIIEAHGGTIWVNSKKGEGSTFSFKIPLKNINQA